MTTFYLDNKGFAASLITVFLAFLLLVWFSYQRAETSVYRDTAEHLVSIAELQADVVRGSVLDSERHVRFLHATPPVQGIVRATQHAGIDPREATPYPFGSPGMERTSGGPLRYRQSQRFRTGLT